MRRGGKRKCLTSTTHGKITPNPQRVTVTGKVHLILADGCSLTASKGIDVSEGNSLSIYGQEKGSGALEATGDSDNAGIGGDNGKNGGTVTIHGGAVTAKSVTPEGRDVSGAGIGGGSGKGPGGSGGTVTIYGGEVTASSNYGAGIGGGKGSYGLGAPGTFSTGPDGHAFIIASSIQDNEDKSAWSGVIFEGDKGAVYGQSVTLTTDATIPANKTLEIKDGVTLTIGTGAKLTNKGTIIVYGELTGEGEVKGEGSIPITGITLDQTTLSLVKGETVTATLQATIKPSIATDKDLTWSSSDSDVATVDANGKVTAVGAGTATITVTADGKTATCTVTVKAATIPVTSVKLDKTELSLFTGGSATLTATVQPDNATNPAVTWSTSNSDVATVEAGNNGMATVTAKGTGEATITVKAADGGFTATCTVTVTKPEEPKPPIDQPSYYNIYVEDVCDGVEVSLSKSVVKEGNSISVYVEKDTANYTFDNFKIYYKRSYYGPWEILEEGVQPGEYPIRNIWTHIYIKAEGAEEKEEDPTGIEQIEGVKVYTKDGCLYVQTPQRETVIIVSMTGAVVKNEEQIGLKQYHGLNQGIYIVRVGDRAYKVRLN